MYKEFTIGEIFRIVNPKGKLTTKQLIDGDDIDYVAAKKTNNGIAKRCSLANIPKEQIMKGNCIVFVQQGDGSAGYTTYQPNDFYAISCVCAGYIDGIMDEKIGLYLVSILDKNKAFFNHSNSWTGKRLINTKMTLPVIESTDSNHAYTPDDIDWQYMRDRISELERDRISELDAYLKVTGLDDYELTEEDKEVLAREPERKEFRIGDLFEKCNLKRKKLKFDKAKDISKERTSEYSVPLVNAKHGNNGIMYYGRKEDWETTTFAIDIVNDGAISTGDVYPQPEETGVLYNAYLIKLEEAIESKEVLMYLASTLEKNIKPFFGYDNKAGWDKVKEIFISLPVTPSSTPDWEYMEKYIRATEKVVIKDVVEWKDKVIEKTKDVVA